MKVFGAMDMHSKRYKAKTVGTANVLVALALSLSIAPQASAQGRALATGSIVIEQPVGGAFSYDRSSRNKQSVGSAFVNELSREVITAIFLERSGVAPSDPEGRKPSDKPALFSSYVGYRQKGTGPFIPLVSDALGGALRKVDYSVEPSASHAPDRPLLFIAQFN